LNQTFNQRPVFSSTLGFGAVASEVVPRIRVRIDL
jgi:hypothetical protein